MKKFWFEIISSIVGIILLCSSDPDPNNVAFLRGTGGGVLLISIVWFIVHLVVISRNNREDKSFPTKSGKSSNNFPIQRSRAESSFGIKEKINPFVSTSSKEEQKTEILNEQIELIRPYLNEQIICSEDIINLSTIRLTLQDTDYIAGKLICSLFGFGTTVKDIEYKTKTMSFSDDEIILIMKHGSPNLQQQLFDSCQKNSYTISSYLFGEVYRLNPLLLFHFLYSESIFHKAFNTMEFSELLGYRTKAKEGEQALGTITTFDGINIPYYEDADTDMISIVEQNFPDNDTLRKQVFDKVFSANYFLTEPIGRLDNLTGYEIKKILDRGEEKEVEALFNRNDIYDTICNLSEEIAIRIYLGLVYVEAFQIIKDHYRFENKETFEKVIKELDAEDLFGKKAYDIIELIEDEMGDDEDLRKLAFTKLCESPDISSRISEWDNVSDEETKIIMNRQNNEEIEALFNRDDADNIVTNFSENIAIKIRLSLIYPNLSDTIANNYQFQDEEVFKQIIEELSPEELLGKDDYDIIKLIEDDMGDDEDLRKLAFTKLCESPDMSGAIARWDSISDEETKIIMQRNNEKEINALFGRDDSEDIICELPEEIAIKIRLSLIYPDAVDTITNGYSFQDEEAFKQIIDELSVEELLGKDDYDIIKLIEDEMGDDEHLRKLAFTKLCESPDISGAIARWDSISEDEVKTITEREKSEEIEALLAKDVWGLIDALPDVFVIKYHLLDDEEVVHDEYFNRIDNDDFRNKVEQITKAFLPKKLTNAQKNSNVESLSDEIIIKARLALFDLDECSFDSDDIANEFDNRIKKDGFKQKIENLNFK